LAVRLPQGRDAPGAGDLEGRRGGRRRRPVDATGGAHAFGVAPTTVRTAAEGALSAAGSTPAAAEAANRSSPRHPPDRRPALDGRLSRLVAGRILVTLLAELGGFSAADLLSL
jgi:hypothetical protein